MLIVCVTIICKLMIINNLTMFRIKNVRGVTVTKASNVSPSFLQPSGFKLQKNTNNFYIKPTPKKSGNGAYKKNSTNVQDKSDEYNKNNGYKHKLHAGGCNIGKTMTNEQLNKNKDVKFCKKQNLIKNANHDNNHSINISKISTNSKMKQITNKYPNDKQPKYCSQNNIQTLIKNNQTLQQNNQISMEINENQKQLQINMKQIVDSQQRQKQKNKNHNVNNYEENNKFSNQTKLILQHQQNEKQIRKKKELQQQNQKRKQQESIILIQKIKQRQRKRQQQKQIKENNPKQIIKNNQLTGIMYSNDPLIHFQFSQIIMNTQINKILKMSFSHFPSGNSIEMLKQSLQKINQSYLSTKDEPNQLKLNEGLKNYRIQLFNKIGQVIMKDQASGYQNPNFTFIQQDLRSPSINSDFTIMRGIPKQKLNQVLSIKNATIIQECGICLQNIKIGDQYHQLPCSHTFHSCCSSQWIYGTANCPICRKNLKQ